MSKKLLLLMVLAGMSLTMQAQPPSDSSPTYPSGATKVYSSGTNTLTDETLSSSTQYYNVVQVSGGTLTMTGCTLTKTGDGSSGDNSSFYGNNSTIYAGSASSSGYSSTSSASGAVINISNCTVTSSSQGANAVFATNGATINVEGITITNNSSVSRGLHCTYGGKIVASDVDITTNEATSSTIATDRGGGTVTVTDGTATANGSKSAVLYSTGTITATNLTGTSAKGEIAVIEGDNSIAMTNCTMTSGSSERGLLMMQSGSGDADGTNPEMTITGSSLTMTDESAPLLEVATCVTATCTLDNCTVTVPSGILMYVMDDDQWSTSGAIGNLVLSNGTYSGIVKYDDGFTANVTVNEGATWSLTANTSIGTLVNNGTIYTNGYTLTYTSLSGSGSITEASETVSITIGSAGQATFSSIQDLDFTDSGLKAYAAIGYDKSTSTIWLTRVYQVPAYTGLLLIGDAGTYKATVSSSASKTYYKNMFQYNSESVTLQTTDGDYTNYYLSNGDSGVGFYKVGTDGVTLEANHAYLPIPTTIETVGEAGDPVTITVGEAGQVTYCGSNSLDFTDLSDEGVKAYTATGYNYTTGTIWLTRVKKVPAGTGILIMASEGSYDVPTASVTTEYENMLKGILEDVTIYSTESDDDGTYTNYYLSNGNYGVGFYKVTASDGVTISANHSYLPILQQSTASTRGTDVNPANFTLQENEEVIGLRLFGSADGTTGIDVQSSIFNLQSEDIWYTLQGQRVAKPGKGLYIHNGKKVVIK